MGPKTLGDGQTDGILEPEALAKVVVETIHTERFYVLPHPEVEEYVRRKGDNIDRWLNGMRRPTHSIQPTVNIIALSPDVFLYFGMGKHIEPLSMDGFNNNFCKRLWFQNTIGLTIP